MASPTDMSSTTLSTRRQKAVQLLNQKLEVIPKHAFEGGRKPSLEEYYKRAEVCFPVHIPQEVSIVTMFHHFNDLKATGFSGAKFENGFNAARAIWYWGIDKERSWSRHHFQIVANVILAGIVVCEGTEPDKALVDFLKKFILAFVSHNARSKDCDAEEAFLKVWWESPYDLVKFTSQRLKKIIIEIKALRTELPRNMPFEPHNFLEQADKQDQTTFCEHAVTWAIKWHLLIPDDHLAQSLAGMVLDREYSAYIAPDSFSQPHMMALLRDIDPDVQPAKKIDTKMWMDPAVAAAKILESNLSGVIKKVDSDLSEAMGNFSM